MKKLILLIVFFLVIFSLMISCSGKDEVVMVDDKGREWIELDRAKITFNSNTTLINKTAWKGEGYRTEDWGEYLFKKGDNYIILSLNTPKHLLDKVEKVQAEIELKYNNKLYKGEGLFNIYRGFRHRKRTYKIESIDGNSEIRTEDGDKYKFKARLEFRD
jgi:hypothetical protein